MPYTPFHFGPGLLFGLLLLSYIDFPTFMLANVIVDIEPILVLYFDFRYPLHGFFHSFLGGTVVAFLLSVVMIRMRPVFSDFRIKTGERRYWNRAPSARASSISSGWAGISLRVLL